MKKLQENDKNLWIGKDGVILSEYQFDFLLLMEQDESRSVLRKFLQKELNTEPLDFLEQYSNLIKNKKHDDLVSEKVMQHLETILNTFVEINAAKELNINLETKKKVKNGFELLKNQISISYRDVNQLFHPLKHIVILELHSDNFQRFIRSDVWKNFIITKGRNFIEKIAEKKPTLESFYRDDDFVQHVVTEMDFEFMEKLSQDSYDWELQGYKTSSEGSIHGYWRSNNLLANVSWSKSASIAKFVGIFNYSVDFISETIFPGYNIPIFDRNFRSYHQYLYYSNEDLKAKYGEKVVKDRTCAVVSLDVEVPVLFAAKRRYLFCASSKYDESKEELIFLNKPCLLQTEKQEKGCIEFKDFMYYRLRKIDENKTQYTQIHIYNMFGWAQNQSLNKYFIWDRAKSLQKSILNILQKKKNGLLRPLDPSDYLARLYLHALEKRQQQYHHHHQQQQINKGDTTTTESKTATTTTTTTTVTTEYQ